MTLFLAITPASLLDWAGFPTPLFAMPLFALVLVGLIWAGSFFPRAEALLRKGRALTRSGQPAEAEQCYRKALAKGSSVPVPVQVRLLVNLGGALMDQGRYGESRESLNRALDLGDPTGSCNSFIAKLLLLQGTEPQKALDMAEQAMQIGGGAFRGGFLHDWGVRFGNLSRATQWAQKAWALALLRREREARQGIEAAANSVAAALAGTPNYRRTTPIYGPDYRTLVRLGVSEAQWTMGMALLAMNDTAQAAVHFRIAYETEPKGKYGKLALRQCEQLGVPVS